MIQTPGFLAPSPTPTGVYIYTHKTSKINKFTQSPSSRAGIPIVGFLVNMAVIKDIKSAMEMAIRPS